MMSIENLQPITSSGTEVDCLWLTVCKFFKAEQVKHVSETFWAKASKLRQKKSRENTSLSWLAVGCSSVKCSAVSKPSETPFGMTVLYVVGLNGVDCFTTNKSFWRPVVMTNTPQFRYLLTSVNFLS